MDWEEYKSEFIRVAKKNKKNEDYCDKWLKYAKKLCDKQLPIIYKQKHLCQLLGYKKQYVYGVSNSPADFYRYYKIPKKNGDFRQISEPLPSLKEIQKWILDNILVNVGTSVYAKAYIKNKSIKDNARFHRKQKVLLSLDIKNFFDSISSDKIFDIFWNLGYKEDVVVMLTNLCCLNGSLPQGAPTSPMLSNIVLEDFDNEIGLYAIEQKIRYTRYADDMTFSGDFNAGKVISKVKRQLNDLGLKLNDEKTRTRGRGQRQEVTGIVVNEKMQLPRSERKKIRQEMHYIIKYGLESHLEYCKIEKANYISHLKGKIEYGLFVNPYDYELKEYLSYLKNITD